MPKTSVAVLGTGLMGSAIARTFTRHGHPLTVWNRTADKAKALLVEGATLAPTCHDAVAAAELTVSVLVDSGALRANLGEDASLEGRAIVNLATGTPKDAQETEKWVVERGGRYLDGTIAAYPKDVGTPGGGVAFSGSLAVWQDYGDSLKILGGTSHYAGERVSDACTLDLAMLTYCMSAVAAFQEGIAYAGAYGVSPERFLAHVLPAHEIIGRVLTESVDALHKDDFRTTEATNETYRAAMALAIQSQKEENLRGAMAAAAHDLYARAVTAGHSAGVPAAIVPVLAAPQQRD